MNALISLVLIVVGYGALALWVAHVQRAFRQKHTPLIAGLLVLPIVLLLTFPLWGRAVRGVGGWLIPELLFLAVTLGLARGLAPREALAPTRETKPVLIQLALLSGSAIFLIPFVWMVSTSLKATAALSQFPPQFIPHPAVWRNYPDALAFLPPEMHGGLVPLQNTLIIAVMSVIGTVLSSSLVAFGFARMRFPGRDWLFGLLLATMMLPDAVTMMPRFLIFRQLHWVDTLLPLWVPSFFASAFNVFLLRQFFLGIPQEMEDAARIDGCGPLGIYWRIMMPLIKPALTAVTLMSFLSSWKDFMNPLIYISSPEKMPLSYVLQLYNSAHGSQPGLLMAATTLVMIPVVLLFFFTQRFFIEGVSLTGLGGR
jgi:ABC-type glycerol-3-phosphate transport system permease component